MKMAKLPFFHLQKNILSRLPDRTLATNMIWLNISFSKCPCCWERGEYSKYATKTGGERVRGREGESGRERVREERRGEHRNKGRVSFMH